MPQHKTFLEKSNIVLKFGTPEDALVFFIELRKQEDKFIFLMLAFQAKRQDVLIKIIDNIKLVNNFREEIIRLSIQNNCFDIINVLYEKEKTNLHGTSFLKELYRECVKQRNFRPMYYLAVEKDVKWNECLDNTNSFQKRKIIENLTLEGKKESIQILVKAGFLTEKMVKSTFKQKNLTF